MEMNVNVCASSQTRLIDDELLGFFINEETNLDLFIIAF
jgi:hypothetical protein